MIILKKELILSVLPCEIEFNLFNPFRVFFFQNFLPINKMNAHFLVFFTRIEEYFYR